MQSKKNNKFSKMTYLLKNLGPGIITGASDDDPSGIATYSQAGAQFGLGTLWTALVTFPLMYAVQEMCGRIGRVTSKGLITNIKQNYSPLILIFVLVFTVPAILLNIGADLLGMGAVSNLLIPSIPVNLFSVIYALLLAIIMINFSYKKIVIVLKYFCISLMIYLIIPFVIKLNWMDVFKNTFFPKLEFNKEYINILVAILGTTISPYLFFWQATMEAEENNHHRKSSLSLKRNLNILKKDIGIGMFFSNLVMYFIILTTGAILFNNGITHIDTVDQAARALEPLAGEKCYLLFAIGVISTGLLAIPVFCSCLAYMITATLNLNEGLDNKLHDGKLFYLIIVLSLLLGLCINLIGISPVKALIYTAVLYGVSAAPIILLIMMIANNKKIMGDNINSTLSNCLCFFTVILMSVAAGLLVYFQIIR
jgi:NRAMP (natural resistance-associated macrophage protein)-like metal ion transporter